MRNKRLKAQLWDKTQFLLSNFYDRMMHYAIFYEGSLDIDIIRKQEEYKDFELKLSQRENDDIQDRLRKFEEIVENPLRCLTKSGFKNNNSK